MYFDDTRDTGQHPASDDRCPICGAMGDCPDTATVPMPYPAFDIAEEHDDQSGPLQRYTVTTFGFATVMRLNDSDAARYGTAAVLMP